MALSGTVKDEEHILKGDYSMLETILNSTKQHQRRMYSTSANAPRQE